MGLDKSKARNGAVAGAAAAFVWAATEPVDKPIFGCEYSDVELLGKAVTRGRLWRPIGLAAHVFNGALFGVVYSLVVDRLPGPRPLRGVAAGMVEHLASWPGVAFTDRFHPARGQLVTMKGNRAAFKQATWRHFLFGAMLGLFEAKLNRNGHRNGD